MNLLFSDLQADSSRFDAKSRRRCTQRVVSSLPITRCVQGLQRLSEYQEMHHLVRRPCTQRVIGKGLTTRCVQRLRTNSVECNIWQAKNRVVGKGLSTRCVQRLVQDFRKKCD